MREVTVGPDLPPALGTRLLEAVQGGDRRSRPQVIETLEALVHAPVVGLLLYGTASDRDLGSASDLDLLVVAGEAVRGGLWGRSGTLEIDGYVEPWEALSSAPPEAWSHVVGAAVLFDGTGDALPRWLAGVEAWRRETADPWAAVDRLRDRVWAHRVVGRVARLRGGDPAAARMQEARLLAALPMLHAQSRRTHETSLTRWLARIRREDPALDAALRRYLARRAARPDPAALRALLRQVLGEAEDGGAG